MSASSKKKLRNAEQLSQLTERQLQEQKEARKLKIFSIAMVAAVVLMVVFAVGIVASRSIAKANIGKEERAAIAVTVGDHEISAAEFNCFFVDAVSNFYNNYGSYASMMGLDVTKALDQQFYNEAEEITWADEFVRTAKENAKAVYGIADEAAANGFTMTEEQQSYVDNQMDTLSTYAKLYGYSDVETYLRAMYGNGCNEEIARKYFDVCYTAQCYQDSVSESLEYTDADIQAKDDENPNAFSTFSYNSYYLNASKFLEGGTKGEDDTVTYSDEEKAAAVAAAKAAAESLTDGITSIEEFDKAIAGLEINAESESAASSTYAGTSYDYIASALQSWISDASRKEGDMTVIPSTTEADGKETVNGYYAVYFVERNENQELMQNVRHILAKFEGGTTDETTKQTTYSDEEKAAAKEAADAIYAEWKAGEATEESFAALAKEKTDDGNGDVGGLYENIYPGQMVTTFNDWCFDESRKAGDTEVIETEFGYHVMYYVGASEQTYRDFMIENTLASEDMDTWYTEILEAQTLTDGNFDYVPGDLVLSSSTQ